MNLTITDLLHREIISNKDMVVVEYDGKRSKIDRLEFQQEAIDRDYKVLFIEALYDNESEKPYLLICCGKMKNSGKTYKKDETYVVQSRSGNVSVVTNEYTKAKEMKDSLNKINGDKGILTIWVEGERIHRE